MPLFTSNLVHLYRIQRSVSNMGLKIQNEGAISEKLLRYHIK